MESFKARIISRGRITIPETTREVLNLKEGDIVEVQLEKLNNPVEAPKNG